jgi:hypothetical protein
MDLISHLGMSNCRLFWIGKGNKTVYVKSGDFLYWMKDNFTRKPYRTKC